MIGRAFCGGTIFDDKGCIVAGIAITQTACRQVEYSNKQGDEHI